MHQPPAVIQQAGYKDSIVDQISYQRRNAITEAVAKASPTVVGINVTEVREYRDPWGQMFGNDPFFRHFFGDRTFKQEVKGLGSGFIISADGYILTNDHVAGNAKEITITMTNGEKYKAELVGTDALIDIALLKIDGKNLPYIKLGNSDDVIIGEWVIAMGNPFGLFEIADKPTVTVGVVSAVGLNLRPEQGRFYRGMIQTDAAINSGNSGGPLLNALGEAIGVNSVIFTPNQGSVGVGFAIPINKVKNIIDELKAKGKIERNFYTGLEIQSVDGRIARYFGLEKAEGVIVSDVRRSSPAEKSGFKVGDIIVEVNGEKIINENNITSIITDLKVGDVLKIKIYREKQFLNLKLKLEGAKS
ncbi:MAG: trypsin-like peptidase domain-containing protein [Bacteroidetes bacterium]|nr:trypsin-like peptidase domain-containing protein [Bacteroidota bacterium]MBU1422424.1 trypsin-like peptidase domain-containing protein [Bacteroidota bacterium]MBU2472260.1 trypsin-like peptidase domain-containing protein [Bacteroidota bacterium]MBU2636921.1 trypsin-like peptidase domain-containing protein [Bacteroidota bacterium]